MVILFNGLRKPKAVHAPILCKMFRTIFKYTFSLMKSSFVKFSRVFLTHDRCTQLLSFIAITILEADVLKTNE